MRKPIMKMPTIPITTHVLTHEKLILEIQNKASDSIFDLLVE